MGRVGHRVFWSRRRGRRIHVCMMQASWALVLQCSYSFPYHQFYDYTVYIYTYIYIWSPPLPKIYTRLFHTFPQVASLHWSTTHICRKHRKYRYSRAFRHVHANCAATSRGFDMCINLAPNLGRRFMILHVLVKLKCWRARYFCSCSTRKFRVFCVL